jgi:hypothetical protein
MSVLLREDWMRENFPPIEEEWPTVTTQVFVKFWGNFFCLVLLEMIEISQGFKTYESI